MTKQVQRRRGTATQHTSFTGAEGELSVNTTNKSVHVHDGSTAGGIELARKDGSNVAFTSGTLDGVTIGGSTAGAGTFTNLTATGTTTLAGASTSGNITFGDNDKAIFGAGSDLQIYHAGADSFINESNAAGWLYLQASNLAIRSQDFEYFIDCNANSSVDLYYDNSKKLATTPTGIDVTGRAEVDGLTSSASIISTSNSNSLGGTTFTSTISGTSASFSASITASGNSNSFGNSSFGTITADGLTVDVTSITGQTLHNSAGVSIYTRYQNNSGNDNYLGYTGNNFEVFPNNTKALTVASGGDISFYEDTGTTAKFFWDASAESLGIGTTSIAAGRVLHTVGGRVNFDNTDAYHINLLNNGNSYAYIGAPADNNLAFYNGSGTERMRIDSSGNVGIGTSSPGAELHIGKNSADPTIRLQRTGYHYTDLIGSTGGDGNNFKINIAGTDRFYIQSSTGNVGIGTSSPSAPLHVQNAASTSEVIRIGSSTVTHDTGLYLRTTGTAKISWGSGGALAFYGEGAGTSERMRIDSSGNLLVGTTDNSVYNNGTNTSADTGINLNTTYAGFARYNGTPMYVNRTGSDGDIIAFNKSGAAVGSIGVKGSDIYHGTGDTALKYYAAGDAIHPFNATTLANRDNAIDLGMSGIRFKDLYLSGGVYLGGTGAANKLDDYERGTWQVKFFDGATEVSPYRENAEYLKIGDWVWVQGTIEFRTNYPSSSTNQASIQNLPFTVSGDLTAFQHGTVKMYNGGTVTTNMFVTPASFSGTTTLYFHPQGHNSASSWIGGVGCSTISTSVNTAITFNFQYRV